MSKKVRVTQELIDTAKAVFKNAKKKNIISGEGLTHGQLRALERKGYVRKMSTFGRSKWAGQSGAVEYVWSWIGD